MDQTFHKEGSTADQRRHRQKEMSQIRARKKGQADQTLKPAGQPEIKRHSKLHKKKHR